MIRAIKVGNIRVQLDNIAYVTERVSKTLVESVNGKWFEPSVDSFKDVKRETGIAVTVFFCAANQDGEMYQDFFMKEAEQFLNMYDHACGTIEWKDYKENKANA